mmetsp:Transcript_2988/g.6994  ORF Transcript_2988/g.6994 Transcript_2988/m.6994 type:complete len:206 (+) Transcript_2988:755-1372(+)
MRHAHRLPTLTPDSQRHRREAPVFRLDPPPRLVPRVRLHHRVRLLHHREPRNDRVPVPERPKVSVVHRLPEAHVRQAQRLRQRRQVRLLLPRLHVRPREPVPLPRLHLLKVRRRLRRVRRRAVRVQHLLQRHHVRVHLPQARDHAVEVVLVERVAPPVDVEAHDTQLDFLCLIVADILRGAMAQSSGALVVQGGGRFVFGPNPFD